MSEWGRTRKEIEERMASNLLIRSWFAQRVLSRACVLLS